MIYHVILRIPNIQVRNFEARPNLKYQKKKKFL